MYACIMYTSVSRIRYQVYAHTSRGLRSAVVLPSRGFDPQWASRTSIRPRRQGSHNSSRLRHRAAPPVSHSRLRPRPASPVTHQDTRAMDTLSTSRVMGCAVSPPALSRVVLIPRVLIKVCGSPTKGPWLSTGVSFRSRCWPMTWIGGIALWAPATINENVPSYHTKYVPGTWCAGRRYRAA